MPRLIDADKLSKTLRDIWGIPKDWDGQIEESCEDAFTAIDDAPTIEAEPVKHGRWIFKRGCYEADECVCSLCGQLLTTHAKERANYCPNCGAKMDGGAEQ